MLIKHVGSKNVKHIHKLLIILLFTFLFILSPKKSSSQFCLLSIRLRSVTFYLKYFIIKALKLHHTAKSLHKRILSYHPLFSTADSGNGVHLFCISSSYFMSNLLHSSCNLHYKRDNSCNFRSCIINLFLNCHTCVICLALYSSFAHQLCFNM